MKTTMTLILVLITNLFFSQNICQSGDCVNGFGKMTYGNYGIYVGNFINGQKNGQGMEAYMIGKDTSNVYRGNFKENEFFGKGSFHVYPFCSYNSDNWTDSKNFTSGVMIRDEDKKVYPGAYVNLAFNENTNVTSNQSQNVVKARESIPQGMFVSHSVNNLNMALGQYSVVFKTDMIAKLANGYKRYFVDVTRYSKKFPVPVGVSIFYQLINDKNQVVDQQVKIGAEECYFNLDLEGTYTIQVAYDFHDCYGDCNKVESATMQFTLNSQDFVYTN